MMIEKIGHMVVHQLWPYDLYFEWEVFDDSVHADKHKSFYMESDQIQLGDLDKGYDDVSHFKVQRIRFDMQRSVNGELVHINEVVVDWIRESWQRMKIALIATRLKSIVRLEVIYREMIRSHRIEKITKVSD